jgi:hypothetical protein
VARGILAPAVVAGAANGVLEIGVDLLGADSDLLGMELESECSHDDSFGLVA